MNKDRINLEELKDAYKDVNKMDKKEMYSKYTKLRSYTKSIKTNSHLKTSEYIREQLKLRCLSYRKLAALTGVNYNLIAQACNGELPNLDTFLNICSYFNEDKETLLKIYELGLKEALVQEILKDKEAYNRLTHIKPGGKWLNKPKEEKNNEKRKE